MDRPAKTLSLWGALAIACAAAPAQKPSVIPLVPAADWHLVSSEKLAVDAVCGWGGDPAVEQEYGVKAIEHRTYTLESKTADVVMEEGPDASAAYGLLTYYRSEAMQPVRAVDLAASGSNGALMARGRFLARVIFRAGAEIPANHLRALLILLGGERPPADVMAALPAFLPAAGLAPGSEKYLLGPVAAHNVVPSLPPDLIGFSQGAEVQVGTYRTERQAAAEKQATLVAITYPTSEIARERFGLIQKNLRLNQEGASIYGSRKGSFVFLVLNADSKSATKVLDQLNVAEGVSWDQKYPGEKSVALQMLEIIVSNLILTLVLVGFSVVGGIGIVLAKRLARKWFPDSAFGNPEEEGLIVLNLK